MMLDDNLKEQVRSIFANLVSQYQFDIVVPTFSEQSEKNEKITKDSEELISFLEDVATCSDKLSCNIIKDSSSDGKLGFRILKDGISTRVFFRMIPTGHEFTTLLLAILNLDGKGKNLPDDVLLQKIKSLEGNIDIKVFISLTCTNCPDVVQALNVIAFNNPDVQLQVIEGGMNAEEIEEYNIQAVPSVWVNDELFHVGRGSLVDLLSKLEKKFSSPSTAHKVAGPAKEYDVIIIGGGPAGITAAIYTARKGLSVAILAERIGGQVLDTVGIENLITVPYSTGKQLGSDLKENASKYAIDILENRIVTEVKVENGKKIVTTSLGERFEAPAMIVATGASWRRLNIPGESEHIGSGVAFCTHCDGPFYKGKKVAVIGGGNSGLEAAIDLSSIATHVTVLEFADTLRGDTVLQDKLKALSNVDIITSAASKEIIGGPGEVNGLVYTDRKDNSDHTLDVEGVFVQIGLSANSKVFANLLNMNRVGEIEIDERCRTNIPGIYAAGDVTTVPFKQIVIAMGEGAKASLTAFEDRLKNNLQ